MKRISIRTLCLVLCLSLVLSTGLVAYATETEDTTVTTEAPETIAPETTEAAAETKAEEADKTDKTEEMTEATEAEPEEATEAVPETTAETEPPETEAETEPVENSEAAKDTETAPETTAESEEAAPETTAEAAMMTISEDAQTADAGLSQVDAPTELQWGVSYAEKRTYSDGELESLNYTKVEGPGYITFKPNGTFLEKVLLAIYKDGESSPRYSMTYDFAGRYTAQVFPDWISMEDFCTNVDQFESGTYYFTITVLGDGENCTDSETVKSPSWTFTKPDSDKKVGTAEKLSWNWPKGTWKNPSDLSNVSYVQLTFYYSASENGEPSWIGYSRIQPQALYNLTGLEIPEFYVQSQGDGYYYFTVQLMSGNIEEANHGDCTDMSLAYHRDSDAISAAAAADALESADLTKDSSTQKKIAGIQQAATANSLTVDGALENDATFVDQVKELEGTNAAGVTSSSAEVGASGASVVGASMSAANSDGSGVDLKIGMAAKDEEISAGYNADTAVQFNMTLEGVNNSEDLDIPVLVTLPIPAQFQDDPYSIVVLHYNSDDSVTEITPNVYWDMPTGQYVAAFSLTSFSDFAFVEKGITKYTVTYTDGVDGEVIFADQKTENILSGTTTPKFTGSTTRKGYTFAGWSPAVADTVTKNVTYTATWKKNDSSGATASTMAVTRLYNPVSGEHLLATSNTEISFLTANGWSVDGLMCYMPTAGTPIYRLYNQVSGEHLYTMNESEIENLTAGDWTKDGIMCYSADSSGTPIYRLYNSDAPAISSHLLSTSQEEMDSLVAAGGWKIEGIALYAAK